ncbi:histidine phosphatase family protein [Ktedonosporobacter rubrisoli]|nr:histidine phosphatase family protein [Ktedonosporobacter rubrisoli]
MTTVWLIRHAESEANIGLPTISPETIKLTDRGVKQAERIAAYFTHKPDLLITSSYIRTKQTAYPALRRFPRCEHEEWPVHEFTYLATPEMQYTTKHDRLPLVNAFWQRRDPHYVDGEGAESFVDFMRRVRSIIERLQTAEENFIAMFSHEQFIRAVIWSLLVETDDIGADKMKRFKSFLSAFTMPNGAILKVQLEKGEAPWFSSIITTHLASLP